MSARASGHIKALVVCPNGELITAREKLVAMVLADSHQDKAKHFTYPSVETIAAESICDKRTCQRYLESLERKGVIRRLRPVSQGRTYTVFYFFPALDAIPEGWQDTTLSGGPVFAKRVAKGWQKGGERVAAESATLIERAREQELQQEQKQKQHPPTPSTSEGESGPRKDEYAGETQTGAAELAADHGLRLVEKRSDSDLEPGRVDAVDATSEHRDGSAAQATSEAEVQGGLEGVGLSDQAGAAVGAVRGYGEASCTELVTENDLESAKPWERASPAIRDAARAMWSAILEDLQKQVIRQSFETWLKPTVGAAIEGHALFVIVPSKEFQHVGDKYGDLIRESIKAREFKVSDLLFITEGDVPIAPRKADADAAMERLKTELCTVLAAKSWVMRQCGFVDRNRKRGVGSAIEAVLRQECEAGKTLLQAAPAMADAWKIYVENGEYLRIQYGPVKFFELAIWKDQRGWAWDEEKLERRKNARVGSR
jgi:hypothetical protein